MFSGVFFLALLGWICALGKGTRQIVMQCAIHRVRVPWQSWVAIEQHFSCIDTLPCEMQNKA